MKTVFEHIEHVKGQPHHVRKRIAFATATFGAALVALVWLVSSIGTGAFAVQGSSFADIRGQGSVEATDSANNNDSGTNSANSGIAGAAAALESSSAPARIEIVDTASSTRSVKKTDQTTIPF